MDGIWVLILHEVEVFRHIMTPEVRGVGPSRIRILRRPACRIEFYLSKLQGGVPKNHLRVRNNSNGIFGVIFFFTPGWKKKQIYIRPLATVGATNLMFHVIVFLFSYGLWSMVAIFSVINKVVAISFQKGLTLPETNIFAPKNGWLEDDPFLLGPGLFSGAMVSFTEIIMFF